MKKIAVTVGEPAGIGPDVVLQALQYVQGDECVVFADPECLKQRAELLQLSIAHLTIVPVPLAAPCQPGQPSIDNGEAVIESLTLATKACIEGECDALLTAPIQKSLLNDAGFSFSGHTEFLADLCGVETVVMLFVGDQFNVALQTTHLPLQSVSAALSTDAIIQKVQILHQQFTHYFQVAAPKIAVCGLNPHAGESGHLGHEDIDIIAPAIQTLQQQGIDVSGPYSADSLFTPTHRNAFDAILAMYHDQGLTPFKALHHHAGVNVTLGLPFLRTSVDHGTALSLAGTGKADCNSFLHALHLTKRLLESPHGASARTLSSSCSA